MLKKISDNQSSNKTMAREENSGNKIAVSAFRQNVARGLSGRLLVLTVAFVMFAEILILVPSIANFRNVWLQNHLDTAEAASIVYLDGSDFMLSKQAQRDLLRSTESLSVGIKDGASRRLMASLPTDKIADETIYLSGMQPINSLRSSLSTLFFGGDRVYRVSGPMKSRSGDIQLVQEDKYLRDALIQFSRNILLISLAISLFTAGLVFLSLYWLIVRPIIKLSSNMDAFSEHPENASLVYKPTGRKDEIGVAEERLSSLQEDLQDTLRQKQHLAELGLAVSKINHDLRNILASAYLFSDRLTNISDPTVQRLAPKLVKTIDRAVEYTKSVLTYGKAMESAPQMLPRRIHKIVDEVGETLGVNHKENFIWHNDVNEKLEIECDGEQIFRAILNLSRNAIQAMETEPTNAGENQLTISSQLQNNHLELRVQDTGPGISPNQQGNLFAAFQGSTKTGGTGLGLAIAMELIRAHGGNITLERTSQNGSTFLITLPLT